MKPSVGRIVHYVSYGTPGGEFASECRAAIVTEVGQAEASTPGLEYLTENREIVGLCVLNPTGQFFNRGVLQNEEHKLGGTWHWPERV